MSRHPIRNGAQFAWRLGRGLDSVRTPQPAWLDDELRHFEDTRAQYWACLPRWLRVPGGRALHAVMDGGTASVCGLEPDRWHRPRDDSGMSLPHHRLCRERAGAVTAERLSALFRRQREEVGDA